MRSRNDIMRTRIRFQAVLLLLFFIYLLIKLYWVQVHRHDYYYAEARKKYVAKEKFKGTRGEIFDAQGNLLVGNMPCLDVSITPCNIKSKHDKNVAVIISRVLKIDYQKVLAKVSKKTRTVNKDGKTEVRPLQYAMIARNVPLAEALHLKTVLENHKLSRNVHFHDSSIRYYPKGQLAANVLGTTFMNNDDLSGNEGVERFFDKELRSGDGSRTFERGRKGGKLIDTLEESIAGLDGKNLYLTLVEPIQSIMEEELDKAYNKWKPKVIYAMMADPATGNILAIGQRPSFDPNSRDVKDISVFRSRVASDAFEPGSVMKPMAVAGALDYGVVTPKTMIDCEQKVWFFKGRPLTDSHAYGLQDVTGVIRKSSNIGTAKMAVMLGEQRLYRTLIKFGLGSKTGLPLNSESRGNLRPPAKWDGLSISRFGIGYGVGVTTAQLLRAYCTLANRGRMPTLRLLDRVEDPQTKEVKVRPIEPLSKCIYQRPEVGEQIVNMMITVTQKGGTAVQAAIPGYHVAGKTGTARKWENGGYRGNYFASFAGFVPAEKPALVLVITFDSPKGSIYGGSVSAPVWKAIAERTLKYMNVPPTVPIEEKTPRK